MLVNLYDNRSARLLAMATVANATGPRSQSTRSRARIIDVGGGWNTRSWRDSLRRLADRGTVTALAVRTRPLQRQLTDAEWQQVARRLARHAGLGQRPWLAVRTSPTTVAVLADSTAGPPKIEDARRFISSVVAGFKLKAGRTTTEISDFEPRLTFLRPSPQEPAAEFEQVPPVVAVRGEADAQKLAGEGVSIAEAVIGREELADKGLIAAVSMQWERMAASPDRGNRIEMAASLAWNHTYSDAFEFGYRTLAKAVASRFDTLHQQLVDDPPTNPATVDRVRELVATARAAVPWRIETPEVPRHTLMTATRAGLERPQDQTIPEAIVRAVCRDAAAIGGLHGAIAATTDIRQEWKPSCSLELGMTDDAVRRHIDDVLDNLRRQLGGALAVRDGSAGPGPAETRSSFAAPPGAQTSPPSVGQTSIPSLVDKLRRSR
ncbi:hypothetical protein GCM10009557_02900 [Virgisporangium ochraceum]